MLHVENLSCRLGLRLILNSVDLDLRPREIVGLVGPPGAGKTTLLECVLGRHSLADGNIRNLSVDARAQRDQASALFAHVPAALSFPATSPVVSHTRDMCTRWGRRIPEAVVRAALIRGGIGPEWHERPLGECPAAVYRKLAFALATLRNARGLLIDEPLTDLTDPSDVERLVSSLRLMRKGGSAILLATRDVAFAQRIATRLVRLEHGSVVETVDLFTSRQAFHADSYLARLVA
jgi:ABC-type multidrug transport system ATPase subunit